MTTNKFVDDLDLEVDDHQQNDGLLDGDPNLEVRENEFGANLFTRNANRLRKSKQLRSRNLWAAGLSLIGFVALILIVGRIRHAHKLKSLFYTRSYPLLLMVFCRISRCAS